MKIDKQNSFMSLYAVGNDDDHQLGVDSSSRNPTHNNLQNFWVDSLTQVNFDLKDVQCVSGSECHTVIIKHGRVFAAGNDNCFLIGSGNNRIYYHFTEVNISKEPISWAACSRLFTLYLTESGKVIFTKSYESAQITVKLDKKAVSVIAGYNYGGIIDEEGTVHIINNDYLEKPTQKVTLDSPIIDIACCSSFTCVLTLDGHVFASGSYNKGSSEFIEVSSLKGKNIEKLSGYIDTCAALSSDGRVFVYGKNDHGSLGNGTTTDNYDSFTEMQMDEAIKDVSCSDHTLLITKSNKILGCGWNTFNQLFTETKERNILTPINIKQMEADQVIARMYHSFVLSGTGRLDNPAKKFFMSNPRKSRSEKVEQKPPKRAEEPKPEEKKESCEAKPEQQATVRNNQVTETISTQTQEPSFFITQKTEILAPTKQNVPTPTNVNKKSKAKKQTRLITKPVVVKTSLNMRTADMMVRSDPSGKKTTFVKRATYKK